MKWSGTIDATSWPPVHNIHNQIRTVSAGQPLKATGKVPFESAGCPHVMLLVFKSISQDSCQFCQSQPSNLPRQQCDELSRLSRQSFLAWQQLSAALVFAFSSTCPGECHRLRGFCLFLGRLLVAGVLPIPLIGMRSMARITREQSELKLCSGSAAHSPSCSPALKLPSVTAVAPPHRNRLGAILFGPW